MAGASRPQEPAARALQGGSIGAIVSSPLRRALETAGYLANRLGIEPVEDARLRLGIFADIAHLRGLKLPEG
ncbi:histidine phosphatase family protein [Saccharibacillus qingshengii]|uniref:histidine phosphatase family protein n=1 Tax=Saccharibacillus qingshengii TaxID=1763540 RepID=UPI001C12E534